MNHNELWKSLHHKSRAEMGKIMEFQVGKWLHHAPGTEYDADGRRAVVKHLCFGPLETRIWYELKDGGFLYENHIIEGIQAGDCFVWPVSKSEMLEVVASEIRLCRQNNQSELASLFQAELEMNVENPDSRG